MKAPKSPDPAKTAAAQTASNVDTATTQQILNMTNQVTPEGSLNYDQTGSYTLTGADGKQYTVPRFTSTKTLSPGQQTLYDQNLLADTNMNNIALGQIDRIGGVLSENFDYSPGEHEAWAGNLYSKLNSDSDAANMAAMESKLANQGLQPGTPAYDDAMRNLTYGQNKARDDFMLGSYNTGMNTALTMRNQPLQEVNALMSGSQVSQPQFVNTPQTGVNGTDIAGLEMAKYNAQNANYQAKLGGIASIGGAALGGWAMSDKRAKKNISTIGKLKDGTKLYSYEYKPEVGGRGLMHIGVMAQESMKKHPDAVAKADDGLYRVNYSRIAEELVA